MARRKKFKRDQAVEVQRQPGAPWELATYRNACTGWSGHHWVRLPSDAKPRYVDSMSGTESEAPTHTSYMTRDLTVPTRRIRDTTRTPTVD